MKGIISKEFFDHLVGKRFKLLKRNSVVTLTFEHDNSSEANFFHKKLKSLFEEIRW